MSGEIEMNDDPKIGIWPDDVEMKEPEGKVKAATDMVNYAIEVAEALAKLHGPTQLLPTDERRIREEMKVSLQKYLTAKGTQNV